MPNANSTLTKRSQMARRTLLAQHYLRGMALWEIAEKLGCNRKTLTQDLAWLEREWLTSALIDFDKAKARELEKINLIEWEATEGWRRSKEPRTTTYREKRLAPAKDSPKETNTVRSTEEAQAGDPRFLEIMLHCSEQRRKMMGWDEPMRMQVDVIGAKERAANKLKELPDDQFNKVIDVFDLGLKPRNPLLGRSPPVDDEGGGGTATV